jgi:hypothetical protein
MATTPLTPVGHAANREPPPLMIRLPYTSEPIYVVGSQKTAAKMGRQDYRRGWTAAKARVWFDGINS